MEWDIFISYAREDEEMVAQLERLLEVFDLKVWLDLNELRAAQGLLGKIGEGMAASRFGVVILSPAYEPKEWTKLQDVAEKVKHCDVTIDVMKEAQVTRANARDVAVMEECNNQIARHLETLNVVRDDIIRSLNKAWKCFGIYTLPIPTEVLTTTQSYRPQKNC